MSTNSRNYCWICLSSRNDDNISEARRYTDIFIQLTNYKCCKDLILCMWCKTILKKTLTLKKLALTTAKILNEQNEVTRITVTNASPYKHLHRLSITAVTQINIPSNINDEKNSHIIILNNDNDVKEDNQSSGQYNQNVIYVENYNFTCTENELKWNNTTIEKSNETIDYLSEEVYYQNENKSPHIRDKNLRQPKRNGLVLINKHLIEKKGRRSSKSKNIKTIDSFITGVDEKKKKKNSIKQKKIELKLEEMKFKVKYLNLEEQKKEVERKKIKYKDMKYQCDLCGVGFLTNDYFESHQIRHTKVAGQYECGVCSLHFSNRSVISQHMLSHQRLFSCVLCGAQFSKWSNCGVHRQKCGSAVAYVLCQVCSKLFSDEYSLKAHMRAHNLEKQYSCEHCCAQFKTKQRLIVHIRSHTGTKPFSCSFCSRSFTTNSNLRAHRTVHSDLSEHYCVECNTHYKTSKSLKRHLSESVRHRRDRNHMYRCKECSKEFISAKSLESHAVRHKNGLQEVICPQCQKTFSTKSNLIKHLKCIHKNVLMSPESELSPRTTRYNCNLGQPA